MQRIRAMNLCLAVFHAIDSMDSDTCLALGRIGSHSVETHFGMVRSMFRGDDSFSHWVSAEVKAAMIERLLAVLEEEPLTRRARVPISGARVYACEESAATNAGEAVDAARDFAAGDSDAGARLLRVVESLLAQGDSQVPRQGLRSGALHVLRYLGTRF
jgi:hypothetical protein